MISVPSTLVLGKMLRWGNINAPQRMFDSIQAYPVSTVLGFDPAQNLPSGVDAKSIPGSGRLDLDFEGKITNKLVSKINEPVTMPQAWYIPSAHQHTPYPILQSFLLLASTLHCHHSLRSTPCMLLLILALLLCM